MGTISVRGGAPDAAAYPNGPPEAVAEFLRLSVILTRSEEYAGHLAGTHRMGSSPRTSVTDPRQRSWDHGNLYLIGCGNMPTVGTSNPSLTMTVLTIWAGENIAADLARRS